MDFSELNPKRKVVVIGAGSVGATFCYALAQSGLADEIVLIDHNKDLARGQVLDLAHGQSFFPPVTIRVGDQQDYADATLLVMTAGARQQPGETRLQLLRRNASIVRQVARDIALANSPGMLVIVSNPVDILTKVAAEETGWRRGRVLGSGTVLDSARFRSLLSHNCGIDIHNIHAYILGEHGDSEFAAGCAHLQANRTSGLVSGRALKSRCAIPLTTLLITRVPLISPSVWHWCELPEPFSATRTACSRFPHCLKVNTGCQGFASVCLLSCRDAALSGSWRQG